MRVLEACSWPEMTDRRGGWTTMETTVEPGAAIPGHARGMVGRQAEAGGWNAEPTATEDVLQTRWVTSASI